jgi:hypothetical protein
MKTYRFSKHSKLNGVLNEIYNDLLEMCDTEEQSRKEIKRYCKEFPRETDCNLAQYGNVLIYYYQVREMYRRHGYKSLDRLSDSKVWEIYKRQAGYVARMIAREAI